MSDNEQETVTIEEAKEEIMKKDGTRKWFNKKKC